jgi:hypothetical protein
MHIRNNYVKIQDLDDTGCQLIVVLPKKIKQSNERIRDMMNDIVYGRISSIEFDWYDEQERLIEEERLAEEKRLAEAEEKRRVEKERVAKKERVVEEPRSARGRSPERPFRKSPGRKSRSPRRKSRSPRRKSRSPRRKTRSLGRSPRRKTRSLRTQSLGGKTLKKRRAHNNYYTVRK